MKRITIKDPKNQKIVCRLELEDEAAERFLKAMPEFLEADVKDEGTTITELEAKAVYKK